jgi:outer membrane protein
MVIPLSDESMPVSCSTIMYVSPPRLGRHRLLPLVLLAVLLTGGCQSSRPMERPPVRLGVVDLQRVLLETEAGKKAREALNTFMKNRQAVVELEEKELKRMEDDLIKQASVLSANGRRDREEVLRRRVVEFQQRATEMNREVQDKQKEILETFRDRAERIVSKIAQELGLLVVMEKGKGGPTVFADESLDISARVIDALNKEAPADKK